MESGHDLVAIARIYSRPEMICYISALEAEGIHTFVTGNHYGSATQAMVAIGGYLVRVPAAQVNQAVLLTAELRLETEPPPLPKSLRRRIWLLALFLAAVGGLQGYTFSLMPGVESRWAYMLLGFTSVFSYPFPITSPGDYRSKSGRMMQLR